MPLVLSLLDKMAVQEAVMVVILDITQHQQELQDKVMLVVLGIILAYLMAVEVVVELMPQEHLQLLVVVLVEQVQHLR
jgi:hypothetical protein